MLPNCVTKTDRELILVAKLANFMWPSILLLGWKLTNKCFAFQTTDYENLEDPPKNRRKWSNFRQKSTHNIEFWFPCHGSKKTPLNHSAVLIWNLDSTSARSTDNLDNPDHPYHLENPDHPDHLDNLNNLENLDNFDWWKDWSRRYLQNSHCLLDIFHWFQSFIHFSLLVVFLLRGRLLPHGLAFRADFWRKVIQSLKMYFVSCY